MIKVAFQEGLLLKNVIREQGMGVEGQRNLGMLQRQDLAAATPVKQILEAPELFDLMETFLKVSKHVTSAQAVLACCAMLSQC